MDPVKFRHSISQFIAATVALMMLAISCFAAVILIFGHARVPRLANLEASRLANVELSELVGTPNYTKNTASASPSLISAISSTLHLPFSDPLSMLTNQLPETTTQIAENNQTESSLFHSISTWATNSDKIDMGWLQPASASASEQMLADNPGINVASPQWMHLSDASGNITDSVLPDVVQYAHQHHIKVWALVDNNFDAKLTHEVLQNPKARANLIDELAYAAKTNDYDGINVDFESMYNSDRDAYTAFIKSLHQKLASMHVTLSVDISPDIVPLSDNATFFHAGLADDADYVCLMAYDEHWGGDQDPGPVADLPWVSQSVYDLLNTGVPTDKLILGMPFYTELWHVHKNGNVTTTATADGDINGILQSHHTSGTWKSDLDLMYARYPETDGYTEIWYPTAQTFNDELSLVNENGLAGISIWSLYWSNQKTWSSVLDALRNSVS
ncbi:glycosyl hydrolase family 18 protein [Alicyclobacillus fodiniaquatilis]|uniref:Glycosyl hydrolase family 18 protein n=1 Tax=Alicyclobacillus fodiniaquatilis TaxID=1661150 RepID=A0ABW4JFB3_9BACL